MSAVRMLRPKAPTSISDVELVRQALDGNRWAEDAIYRRYARPLAGVATRLLGSRQDVDDIVHDAFVDGFTKLDRLRDPAALRSWLTQITLTLAKVRKMLRRRRLGRALGVVSGAEDACLERIASNEISPEMRAELAVVDGVLRRLGPNLRIAWMLRYVEVPGGVVFLNAEQMLEIGSTPPATPARSTSASAFAVPPAPPGDAPGNVIGIVPDAPSRPVAPGAPAWRRLASNGDYDRAYEAIGGAELQRRGARSRSASELFTLADIARFSGHSDMAVEPLQRLITEHDSDSRAGLAALTLARLQLDALHDPESARISLRRAEVLGLPANLRETALARSVEASRRAGRGEEAQTLARRYLETYPTGRDAERIRAWLEP